MHPYASSMCVRLGQSDLVRAWRSGECVSLLDDTKSIVPTIPVKGVNITLTEDLPRGQSRPNEGPEQFERSDGGDVGTPSKN